MRFLPMAFVWEAMGRKPDWQVNTFSAHGRLFGKLWVESLIDR